MLALILLFLFSNPFLFNFTSHSWESKIANPTEIRDTFEVAIVLGGISSFDEENQLNRFSANADRILNVLPLYFDGRVKKIMLSGGSGSLDQEEKEAEELANYLEKIGVSSEDLILESNSRNTYENAAFSAAIIQERFPEGKVLLSTSSTHMPRALACFEKQGLSCLAFAVDENNKFRDFHWSHLFLPQADILHKWYWLIHEYVGFLTYKIVGYC